MANHSTRRTFLKAAPLAAVVSLPLAEDLLLAQTAVTPTAPFQLFTAEKLSGAMKTLEATQGNDNLFDAKSLPVTIVMTYEAHKSAKEFEYHAGRDHIFQILDGETTYEVGGTPKNARSIRPGEYLAPESEGAKTFLLKKGDMLVIPRGTPHKRTTAQSVTLLLISTTGNTPA